MQENDKKCLKMVICFELGLEKIDQGTIETNLYGVAQKNLKLLLPVSNTCSLRSNLLGQYIAKTTTIFFET